jgi:hypothetical protein
MEKDALVFARIAEYHNDVRDCRGSGVGSEDIERALTVCFPCFVDEGKFKDTQALLEHEERCRHRCDLAMHACAPTCCC